MWKLYFPNLNGLRFIAAFAVIIHHIEQFKSIYGYKNYWDNPSIRLIGKLGVILFFVLSGFLITYLLLNEKRITANINIKNFYIRRILRIWPLYYLIVLIGLTILPTLSFFYLPGYSNQVFNNFDIKILLFLFFMPNLALSMYNAVPYISQSWSIGVEEQFYLLWPLIIGKFKNILLILSGIIFLYIGVKFCLIYSQNHIGGRYIDVAVKFWEIFYINSLSIGSIAAYILYKKKNYILLFLYNKYTQIVVYIMIIFFVSEGYAIRYFEYEPYSILFAIVIINLAGNKKSILNLENKVLSYLGKISYGLYMFHPIAIVLSIKILLSFSAINVFSVFSVSMLFTIVLSSLSYELFEKRIIKAKVKYSVVITGDNV